MACSLLHVVKYTSTKMYIIPNKIVSQLKNILISLRYFQCHVPDFSG